MKSSTKSPLPVQPPKSHALLIGAIAGGAALAILVAVAAVFALRSDPPPDLPTGPLITPTTNPTRLTPPVGAAAPSGLNEEELARDLFDGAETFARQNGDQPDLVLGRFRAVSASYPSTTWAAKARDRAIKIEEELKQLYEREFESLRRDAGDKAKAGDLKAAIAVLDAYLAGKPRDILRRRAAIERVEIENAGRAAFNSAVTGAEALAKQGKFDQAIASFEAVAKGALPDVASACAEEITRLRASLKAFQEASLASAAVAAEEKLRTDAAKALPLARARKFDEAIAALPDVAEPLKPLVEDERAALRAAAEFWKAVEAGAKSHVGTEVSLKLGEGGPAKGRLAKCTAAGVCVGDREIAYGELHDDQLLLFAFAKDGLSGTAGESYAKAAMYFFTAGKDALAKLELATAKELGADIARFERVWRAGLLRSATSK